MIVFYQPAWGAKYGRGQLLVRPRSAVFIHHTGDNRLAPGSTLELEQEIVRRIERHHVIEKEWAAIGYHWLISPNGHVYEGRGWDRVGAHVHGWNSSSIGICLMLDGETTAPTPAAMEACRSLIELGVEEGKLDAAYDLRGHRDHAATDCPGDVLYSMLHQLCP